MNHQALNPAPQYEPSFPAVPPSYEQCATRRGPMLAVAGPLADVTIRPLAMAELFDWEAIFEEAE